MLGRTDNNIYESTFPSTKQVDKLVKAKSKIRFLYYRKTLFSKSKKISTSMPFSLITLTFHKEVERFLNGTSCASNQNNCMLAVSLI